MQVLDRPAETTDAPEKTDAEAAIERLLHTPLTSHDRCDASATTVDPKTSEVNKKGTCGAQAFLRAVLPSGRALLFCGHHLGKQSKGKGLHSQRRAALEAQGARFTDDYGSINLKPTDPS